MRHHLCFGFITLLAMPSFAQDFFAEVDVETENSKSEEIRFKSKGYLKQKVKYGLAEPDRDFAFERQDTGLDQVQSDAFIEFTAKVKPGIKLQLSAKAELDWLQWNSGEQQWTLNHQRLFLRDAYLDASFDNGHWLRVGHQVFAWGEAEGLAISDVIAPRDLREFAQVELRDIREQVPAIMWAMPSMGGTLNWVATWQAGQNRYASDDEGFYPYIAFKDSGLQIDHLQPDETWELALKYDYQFNGGDFSVVAADVNSDEPSIKAIDLNSAAVQLYQERVRVLAISINRAKNAWLFKAELGRHWNQSRLEGEHISPSLDQWRNMLGAEYSGWNNWRLSYELNLVYQDGTAAESSEVDGRDLGHVARISHDGLNERLNQQLWFLKLLQDNGSVIRYDLNYELNENLQLGAALVLYDNTEPQSPLHAFRHHDTLNVSMTLSF